MMNTKYFKDVTTLEELRKQYKTLLKKYHPDCGGSEEATKEIIAEYEKLFSFLKDNEKYNHTDTKAKEAHEKKYNYKTDKAVREAIERIIRFAGLKIEIVGTWIYVTGNTFQYKEEIKNAKFWWSKSKKCWFWGGSDDFKPDGSRGHSMKRNRNKYGSETIETENNNNLLN